MENNQLDALDVDNLLSFFNQPAVEGLGPGTMPSLAQLPLRNMSDLMANYPINHLNPAANLFSSIAVPSFAAAASNQAAGTESNDDKKDSADDKDEKGNKTSLQEKNRRAQKRFRERQKAKMKDMTEHLDDMNKELSKLRMENNSLKNRNSVLEKVLTLRDEHIRVMQDEQHVFDLGNPYLQNINSQKMLTNPCGLEASTSNSMIPLDVRSIKNMPAEAVIGRWKDAVRDLGNILVRLESCTDQNSKEYQDNMAALCQILDSAGQMCMNTAVLHPTNMQRLISATLDDGRSGISADDRERWGKVAATLHLSDSQKGQMISLRSIFLKRMCKVTEERRQILSQLQGVSIPDRMMALQAVISETLKVNSCTAALKANLQEEHLAGLELVGTVFKTILTPIQKARAVVQSYPFYPDIYQISTCLAAESGVDLLEPAPIDVAGGSGGDPGNMLTIPTSYKRT